jgi:hypothetical protein
MTSEQRADGVALVQNIIQTFISGSSQNNLQNQIHEKDFGQPLVGFCSGDVPSAPLPKRGLTNSNVTNIKGIPCLVI